MSRRSTVHFSAYLTSARYAACAVALAIAASACHPQPVARDAHVTAPATRPAVAAAPFAQFTVPSSQPFAPLADQKDLENAHVVTDKIISGAQPENDKSFQLLQELGIKSI